jgi:hypothetical protein
VERNTFSQFAQDLAGQVCRALVFAEDHHLAVVFPRQFPNDLAEFLELGRMVVLEQQRFDVLAGAQGVDGEVQLGNAPG